MGEPDAGKPCQDVSQQRPPAGRGPCPPPPPAGRPAPLRTTAPCRHSTSSDHRLGGTPRPPQTMLSALFFEGGLQHQNFESFL